jgi:hypothetical protein
MQLNRESEMAMRATDATDTAADAVTKAATETATSAATLAATWGLKTPGQNL